MSPISSNDSRTAPKLNPEVVEFKNCRGRALISRLYPTMISGLVIGAIGSFAISVDEPWLFPSLGPTVFMQAVTPSASGARVWNTIVGHAIGLVAGFIALFACAAQNTPAVMSAEILSMQRVAATALAVSVTVGRKPPAWAADAIGRSVRRRRATSVLCGFRSTRRASRCRSR